MKKLSSFVLGVSFLAAIAVLGPERAHADTRINPVVLPKFQLTAVKGNIKVGGVAAPTSGPLAGWNCDDMYVSLESKEQLPLAPGALFPSPKWMKGAKATGSWASGTCTFQLGVVPNSPFYVRVSANGKDYPCDYIQGMLVGPAAVPVMTVPKGTVKQTPDFTVSGAPVCSFIN